MEVKGIILFSNIIIMLALTHTNALGIISKEASGYLLIPNKHINTNCAQSINPQQMIMYIGPG